MSHPLYDVTAFEQVGAYKVRVHFDDGTEQLIDFEPVLYGEMYEPLRDRSFFRSGTARRGDSHPRMAEWRRLRLVRTP